MQDNEPGTLLPTNQILIIPIPGGVRVGFNGVAYDKSLTHDELLSMAARFLQAASETHE